VTAELVPAAAATEDERWLTELKLVGQWLLEHSGNTLAAYSSSIGWPYRTNGTWRGYQSARNGVTWLGWCHTNGVYLLDAKRIHILAWIEAVNASRHPDSGEPLAKRSRAQLVSTASSFYTWAMHEGHTESNPVALINRRKKQLNVSHDPSASRSLSATESQAMIAAADNDPVQFTRPRTAAIIALLFCCGPRVGEVCNAKLSDMRVQDGRRVLRTVAKGGKELLFALPPQVCTRLDAYLATREDISRLPARRGEGSGSSIPLIATSTGKPLGRGEVRTLVKRIARFAGLDDPQSVYPHVARHTYITEARRLGYSGDVIQHSVGHAHIEQTDKYGKHIINIEKSPAYGVAEAFAPERQS